MKSPSGLRVRVVQALGINIPRNGVVANIYALDSGMMQHSKRNIVLPVGDSPAYQDITLGPGPYLVEAVLPSGDILTKDALIREGEWVEVDLISETSPAEGRSRDTSLQKSESETNFTLAFKGQGQWLPVQVPILEDPSESFGKASRDRGKEWKNLHNFLGNLESEKSETRSYQRVESPSPLQVWLMKHPPALFGAAEGHRSDTWKALGRWIAGTPQLIFDNVGSLFEVSSPNAFDYAAEVHTFRLDCEYLPEEDMPRFYAVVSSNRAIKLVSVPVPWVQPRQPKKQIPVELLVRQNDQGDVQTFFSVLDSDLGTALAYMARGDLTNAALMMDQFDLERMLFDKIKNPLGAAAGAYLLLGTQVLTQRQQWFGWIKNLMNLFPWLPDGAIQHAWLMLRRGASKQERLQARRALTTAFNRGLPYYSLGLQWLVDGLTLLGDDEQAKHILQTVQQVTWRADLSQTFTSIALAR